LKFFHEGSSRNRGSGGSSPQHLGGHGPMASAIAQAYNGGPGGGAPCGVEGQSSWSEGQGAKLP